MRITSIVRNQDGFTIQELLVAIVAGSLLVGFAFSLYLFVTRMVVKDGHRREHRETAYATVVLMARDLEHASRVVQTSDSLLVLEALGHGTVEYNLREGRLARNGIPLGPAPDEVWHLEMHATEKGRIALGLRSSWKGDSMVIRTEVSPPRSSLVSFSGSYRSAQ